MRYIIIGYGRYNARILPFNDGDATMFKTLLEAEQWLKEYKHMYKFSKWKIVELGT